MIEWTITLVVAVLLASAIREWVFQPFFIPTTSMVPALDQNDRILVQRAFFDWHNLKSGDIVVFTRPPLDNRCSGPADDDLVKRVIALPGQSIYSQGDTVYVDGRPLPEPYLPKIDPFGPPIPNASPAHPYQVPPGDFYVLGDNRSVSCDSRFWGPIKGSSIVGKVILVWWHDGLPDFHWF
jgi:signal peptidase I